MDFRRGSGAARGCLAGALISAMTATLAGAQTVPGAGEGAPVGTPLGSAVHAQVLRQAAALPPADRIRYLRTRAEAGESAVLLSFLAQEEVEQAGRAPDVGEDAGGAVHATLGEATMAEAARHGLAAYVAMRTAAPLCSDRTSPDQYLSELGQTLRPILGWLSRQDVSIRQEVARAALVLDERTTVPGRPDPMLCRRGQHGDRFCPPGADSASCPEGAAPVAEFTMSESLLQHQRRMRKIARGEVEALAR